jgi:hypothetical protein
MKLRMKLSITSFFYYIIRLDIYVSIIGVNEVTLYLALLNDRQTVIRRVMDDNVFTDTNSGLIEYINR